MGACLEYDNHFRDMRRGLGCPTAELIERLAPEFSSQIVLGMDLARRSYWPGFGGGPGPAWLLNTWTEMLRERGTTQAIIDNMLIHNPAKAFRFHAVPTQ